MDEFYCSELVATLGLTSFVCGLVLGPALPAPLSKVSISYFWFWFSSYKICS
ncbi:hypothetical protein V1523DRAFT_268865 [Lipomyces doorenjongii]